MMNQTDPNQPDQGPFPQDHLASSDSQPQRLSHQPPYDEARYARFQPEPWDPGQQPQQAAGPKRVWYAFIVYCCVTILLGFFIILMGVVCLYSPQAVLDMITDPAMKEQIGIDEVRQTGRYYLALGGIFVLAYSAVFLLPHNVYKWGLGIGLILLTAVTCLMAPFALVMLIFWLLPSTRMYFQQEQQGTPHTQWPA